jgi:hypothetical protein
VCKFSHGIELIKLVSDKYTKKILKRQRRRG